MQQAQQNLKPVVILDDDENWAGEIGRCVKRLGGLPVEYYASIEAFYRYHHLESKDQEGLSRVLGGYSALVCDNNFETPNPPVPGDGRRWGGDFLLNNVGPAIETMTSEGRPIVMCFAPSSMTVIRGYEKRMWDQYGIISFHKLWETAGAGLAIRITREYGTLLSRDSIVHAICQQDLNEDDYDGPKAQFFLKLRHELACWDDFSNDEFNQVAGDANPMPWEEIVASLAQRLNTSTDQLSRTIDTEVQKRNSQIEGQGKHPEHEGS